MYFKRLFIEKAAQEYETGKKIKAEFESKGLPVKIITSHQGVRNIPGDSRQEEYKESKRTLVVGIRKSKQFQTCKPSADFQLPIATSCPGMCQYCYLNTNLGKRPYVRTYVNIDEILELARKHYHNSPQDITVFEGSATSDPLAVEDLTGNLKQSIEFFAGEKQAKFRFATKFTNVDSLLKLEHNKSTEIRFSLNTEKMIKKYEKNTPSLEKRLQSAAKVAKADYPLGFLIAPIFIYDGWQDDYKKLLQKIEEITGDMEISLEIITHRFTTKAKNLINEIFPGNDLPMDEATRRYKYGQFGYGKYIYPEDKMKSIKSWFLEEVEKTIPGAKIEYIV